MNEGRSPTEHVLADCRRLADIGNYFEQQIFNIFYKRLSETLSSIGEMNMSEGHTPWEGKICPECSEAAIRVRRNRKTDKLFYACASPYCNHTWNIDKLNEWEIPEGYGE